MVLGFATPQPSKVKRPPPGQSTFNFTGGSFQGFKAPPVLTPMTAGGKRTLDEGAAASPHGEEEEEEGAVRLQAGRSETENNRKWKQKWVLDVPDGDIWAYYCTETESIKCKACQLYGKDTALSRPSGIGSQRIRLWTLKEHASNEDHKLAQ